MSNESAISRPCDPRDALLAALQRCETHDDVQKVMGSFRLSHVVMPVTDYNDDLQAMMEWQEAAKARIAQYESMYGAIHDLADYEGLSDHPLGFFADESDNF